MRIIVIIPVVFCLFDIGYIPPPGDPYEIIYPRPLNTGNSAPSRANQTGVLKIPIDMPSAYSGFAIWAARDMPMEFQGFFQNGTGTVPDSFKKPATPQGLPYDPVGTLLSFYGFMLKAIDAEFAAMEGLYGSHWLCQTKEMLLGMQPVVMHPLSKMGCMSNELISWRESIFKQGELLDNVEVTESITKSYETVTRIELTSYFPFSLYPFAPGLELLDRQRVYIRVKEMLDEKDVLLRNNAIAWLGENGYYDDLFQLLQRGKLGKTARMRAIYYLTQARKSGLSSWLVEYLGRSVSVLELFAIDSLSRVGSENDIAFLQKMLKNMVTAAKGVLDKNRDNPYKTVTSLDIIYLIIKSLLRSHIDLGIPDKNTLRSLLIDTWEKLSSLLVPLEMQDEKQQQYYAHQYYPHSIRKAVLEVLNLGLAYCGDEDAVERVSRLFRKVYQEVKSSGRYDPAMDGSLRDIVYVNRILFIRILPYIMKKSLVTNFLESLINSGSEHYRVTQAAISELISGESYDRVLQLLSGYLNQWKKMDGNVVIHVIRLASVYARGNRRIERSIEGIVKGYNKRLGPLDKSVIAAAILYLNDNGQLEDSLLSRIADDEVEAIERRRKNVDPEELWESFYAADFTKVVSMVATDRLLETALSLLASRRSEGLPRLLKKMVETRDLRLRRLAFYYMRYDDEMEEDLKEGLEGIDILSRLICFESLQKIN